MDNGNKILVMLTITAYGLIPDIAAVRDAFSKPALGKRGSPKASS
jgi:hypothetical protein